MEMENSTVVERPDSNALKARSSDFEDPKLIVQVFCFAAVVTSLVKGMRMLLFRLRFDGVYRKKSKGNGAMHEKKEAMSRIMVAACKMR